MPPARDVSRALSRIQSVLGSKQEAQRASRDIRFGLERINRVLPEVQEWRGVHVGGTNGKGSICAFLSGLFSLAGISYGRYVSPAFPNRHNGVMLNGRTVNLRTYETERHAVESQYQKIMRGWRFATSEDPGPLSPFELDTATAFRIFNRKQVKYGIVEVGMGGALDATNAMRRKAITVISKIDLDHQEYLGRTITDIAKVKAGIMRPGIPCIVDHTNSEEVINVLRQHARGIGAHIHLTWKAEPLLATLDNDRWQLEDYQKQNLLCAAMAFRHLFPYKKIDLDQLLETEPYLPGRMEWVDVSKLTSDSYQAPVLVDAAHNLLGVQALARHVDSTMRSAEEPITWVMGLSSSNTKPFTEMIETLVRPQDNVAFVEYKQGDNEPQPTPAELGRDIARSVVATGEQVYDGQPDIQEAFQWATSRSGKGHVIVTGSLYLIRDFYNLEGILRFRETKTQRPGSSQLWRFTKLMQHRPLTKEEHAEFERARSYWVNSRAKAAMRKSRQTEEEEDSGEQPLGSDLQDLAELDEMPSAEIKGADRKDRRKADGSLAELTRLHRAASFHKTQIRSYRSALRALTEDLENNFGGDKSLDADTLLQAQQDKERMQLHLEKHSKPLEELQEKIRKLSDPLASTSDLTEEQSAIEAEFADLASLRQAAHYHKVQLHGYRSALRSIKRDVELSSEEGALVNDKSQALTRLRGDAELMEQQADKHQERLEQITEQIRLHPDAPRAYRKLLQHMPRFKAGGVYTPFQGRTELDPEELTTDDKSLEPETPVRSRRRGHDEDDGAEKDFWGRKVETDTRP
jgi:dihydrofolate synthase